MEILFIIVLLILLLMLCIVLFQPNKIIKSSNNLNNPMRQCKCGVIYKTDNSDYCPLCCPEISRLI